MDKSATSPQSSLNELLSALKEEIETWELENDPSSNNSEPATQKDVRYGLYLIALDILLCETTTSGGYERYAQMSVEAKLGEEDYAHFCRQLEPFVIWLKTLNVRKALEESYTEKPAASSEAGVEADLASDAGEALSDIALAKLTELETKLLEGYKP